MAAQFSLPYVLAVALTKGGLAIDDFEEKAIRNRRMLELARKVRITIDPTVAAFFPAHEPGKITVRLANGETCSTTVISSKGTPANPMTDQEIETKFVSFASRVISPDRARQAADLILGLDTLQDVRALSSCLGKHEQGRTACGPNSRSADAKPA
jgi:2-methylcitrate dehydratase